MPNLDVIRNLTIRATQQGVTETTAALTNLAGAQGRVSTSAGTMATVTDIASKRQLSAAAALSRLAASHDETYRAQQQHARGTALLERATAQGLAGTREFAIAQTALNKLHHEAGAAVGFNRMQMMEATHVAKSLFDEIAAGASPLRALSVEAGRIGQIFTEGQGGVGGALKATAALAGRLATGWVGLSVATAAAVGVGVAATVAYENSQARIQRAIEGTGRAAGLTVAQLSTLADAGARAGNLGIGEARGIAGGYVQAGLSGGQTEELLGTTARYARFTGQDNADAGKQLAGAFKDPVAGASLLDKSLGFLNDRLATTIHDYEASGQHAQAQLALQQAYEAALKGTTDETWALGEAMRDAKRWAGGIVDAIGKGANDVLTGGLSKEDQLKAWQSYLPSASDSALSFGRYNRGNVQAHIDALQHEIESKPDPAAAARDAETNRLSNLVGPLVRGILPELTRATDATNNLNILRQALTDPGVVAKLGGGLGRDQVETAFQRTSVVSANADPLRRMSQDYQLALASADAFSLAERAAVEARRAELAVLRESGDVTRAATAARMAENEVIAKANSDAEDRLGAARDQASLVGLFGADRAKEELRLKYEGYGGVYGKDTATRSELKNEMKPVANDLRDAGQSIVKALHDVAMAITSTSPYGTLNPMKPNDAVGPFYPAPFHGSTGPVSDHERTMVDMLVKAGFTNRAADAGYVGGMAGESTSGLDPMAKNASGHRGIEQWDPSRFAGASAFGDPNAFLSQAQLVIRELQTSESAAGAMLRSATTIQGGLTANLRAERPSQGEIASSYNARLAYGTAIGADLAGLTPRVDHTVMTVRGPANNNVPSTPSPTAGVPLVAATALGTDHQVYGTEEAARRASELIGPIHEATVALDAQRASLAASTSTFGMSTSAVAAAAEKQKLLSQYASQNIPLDDATRSSVDRLAQSYGALAQAQQDAQKQQRDLIGAMDDVRGSAKDFLNPLIQAGLHGTSVLAALHQGLEAVASRLSGKLEDSLIDSVLGPSGSAGGGLLGGGLSKLFGGATAGGGLFASLGAGMASGGFVRGPGSYTSDSIPTMLSSGEFVVRAASAAANSNLLHAINTTGMPRMADGGTVGVTPSSGGGAPDSGGLTINHYWPGGIGDAHIESIAQRGTMRAIAQNNANLPSVLSDQKRRAS